MMKTGVMLMCVAIGMLLGLGNYRAMGADPEHGLVGIRPWPVNPSHQAGWGAVGNFLDEKGNYPFSSKHVDTIFQSYSFDGGFQSKRFFAEYYWGMSAARDDLDPTKNELINYIKRWEASGAEFEHILICREWEVQGAHWPEAKPGPFKGDTRILFEKDVDDIRELFRQAHQAGLIKHDNYKLIQMVGNSKYFSEEPLALPIILKMDGIALESHQFNNHLPLETAKSKPENVVIGAKWTLAQGKEYILYYGPFQYKPVGDPNEWIERDWLQIFWAAGLPKHHPRMHYYINNFSFDTAALRPVGPEGDPHSYLGFMKWLIQEIKPETSVDAINIAPIANRQSVTALRNTAKSIALTGSDGNADVLTYSIVTGPTHGALSGTPPNVIYTPTANYLGKDSFTFKVNDGTVFSPVSKVNVGVVPVSGFVNESFELPVLSSGAYTSSPAGATWTFSGGGIARNGNYRFVPAAPDGTQVAYIEGNGAYVSQPLTMDAGTYMVSFSVVGKYSGSMPLNVQIDGSNVLSLAANQISKTAWTSYKTSPFTVLAGSHTLKFLNGTLSSSYGNAIDKVQVHFVDPLNVAPVSNSQSVTMGKNKTHAITLTGSDAEDDLLSYSIVTQPTHGVLTGTAPNVTYTPAVDYTGADSFTFKVSDGSADSSSGVVQITVNPLPELTASLAAASISENGGSTIATISRSGTSGDLVLALASSDTSEATVPASATITNGNSSVQVAVTAVNDTLQDGTQAVTISVSASGYVLQSATVNVTDDEVPFLVNAGPDQSAFRTEFTPWTPAEISTTGWYDASDTSTITQESGAVTQWKSKDAADLIYQGTATARPTSGTRTINGLNVIYFDGTSDFMKMFTPVELKNKQVLFVMKKDVAGSGTLFSDFNTNTQFTTDATTPTQLRYTATTSPYWTNERLSTQAFGATTTMLGGFIGTSNLGFSVNGNYTTSAGNAAGTQSKISMLGKIGNASAYFLKGGLAEIVILPTTDAVSRQKVEGYLAHKWGVAGNLPANHPYKASAPTVLSAVVMLNGAVTGGGLPQSNRWSRVSGPGGAVTFTNASAAMTSATFTAVGNHVLRLTADDGSSPGVDEVVITVGEGYTVDYVGNGSTSGNIPLGVKAYKSGATVSVLGNTNGLIRPGYAFSHWNSAANGSGTSYAAGATFLMPASNVMIHAQWTALPTQALVINGGVGFGNYAAGVEVPITANPPQPGYRFAGWVTSGGGSFANSNAASTVFTMPGNATTLTAQYGLNSLPVVNAGIDQNSLLAKQLWTPGAISTRGWYDAADVSTIAADGNDFVTLRDKSGNNRHLSSDGTGGAAKTGISTNLINGLNTIHFDGTSRYLTRSGFPVNSNGNLAIFTVMQNLDVGSKSAYRCLLTMTATNRFQFQAGTLYGFNGSISATGIGVSKSLTGGPFNGPSSYELIFDKTGGYYNAFIDGTKRTTDTAYTNSLSTSQELTINRNKEYYMICRIGEVIFTDDVSSETRQNIEGYLAHKWGTTAKLPVAHPYKTLPPRDPNTELHTLNLDGTASDPDGDAMTTTWSVVDGPGVVSFGNANAVDTTATFGIGGVYTLRLTAHDGYSSSSNDCVITVLGTSAIYTVAYNGNGSTGGVVPIDVNSPYVSGATVTVLGNAGSLVKTGYTFDGWNTAANGTGTSYLPAETFVIPSENRILYAMWVAQSEFNVWANQVAGEGITFTGDSNQDGVADGLAWLLGATAPQANANGLVPSDSEVSDGALTLSFKLLKPTVRGSAVLQLQYSKDLGVTDPWTNHTITVPDSSGNVGGVEFIISPITGTDLNQVQATVPASAAGAGGKVFVRLNGEVASP